jgi:hypothetical protein
MASVTRRAASIMTASALSPVVVALVVVVRHPGGMAAKAEVGAGAADLDLLPPEALVVARFALRGGTLANAREVASANMLALIPEILPPLLQRPSPLRRSWRR